MAMGGYHIAYVESAAESLPELDFSVAERIKSAIDEKLAVDPIRFGKPLQYDWKGARRLRVGDWRIIYDVKMREKLVTILAVKHRSDGY